MLDDTVLEISVRAASRCSKKALGRPPRTALAQDIAPEEV
jgi:hypothetical protein